jgi:hypothetical protein
MDSYESPYEYENESYTDRRPPQRPWRRQQSAFRAPPMPSAMGGPAARGDVVTRPELQTAISNVTRDVTTQTDAINQRITDALINIKKEATGTKRGLKNANMMAVLPLLLTRSQNLSFKKVQLKDANGAAVDVLSTVEDAGASGTQNDSTMLLIVMMMMMGMGDKDDDSGMAMMMPLMVLLLRSPTQTQKQLVA